MWLIAQTHQQGAEESWEKVLCWTGQSQYTGANQISVACLLRLELCSIISKEVESFIISTFDPSVGEMSELFWRKIPSQITSEKKRRNRSSCLHIFRISKHIFLNQVFCFVFLYAHFCLCCRLLEFIGVYEDSYAQLLKVSGPLKLLGSVAD